MSSSAKMWWGVAGICLVAFVTIAVLSANIFEHVPHSEDEVAYIFQAKVFAQNRLAVPTPPLKSAFWSPFVVDYEGQRFGKYHPGWPLLLSIGVRLNAPWIINALLGTVTLALIAWLGYGYFCAPKDSNPCYLPVVTAGLGLVTPGFLLLSSSLLSHTASLFWNTLALVFLYLAVESTQHRQSTSFTHHPARTTSFFLLTGASLGAAFVTRPFAAFGIGLGIGIFLLTLIHRNELKWTALLWIILGGLPVAAILPLFWRAVTGNPTFNGYLLVWPYDRVGFGPDIGPQGYTLYDAIFINTWLKLSALATGLFGWPEWVNLVFIPIPFLARNANRWDWLLLGTIGGMILVHIFYWAFGGVDGGFPRYYYDALPALLLLTARGILISVDYLRSKQISFGNKQFRLHWMLIGLIICFVAYNLIWFLPAWLAFQKGKYNITPAPLRVVEQANFSEPTLILVNGVQSWSDFAAPFAANSPTLDGPVVYAINWAPEYTWALQQQFSGKDCWELQGQMLEACDEGLTTNDE